MSMKNMLIVFFVSSLILLMLTFPFKSRLMGHFNLIEKKGFYSFKAWRIKLLCGRVYIDGNGELKIENTQNAIKDKYKDAYMKRLSLELLKALDVKKVELFFSGGFEKNSFSSAMLCGSASVFVNLIYSFLSQRYENVRLFEDVNPTFNKNSLELTFDFVVSISLLQILISMVRAKIEQKREVNV